MTGNTLRQALTMMALSTVLTTASGATLVAQDGPAPSPTQAATPPDITVIAPTPIGRKAAKDFALGISLPVKDQVARYNGPICPVTLSFPAALGRQIMRRMLDDIVAAHAAIGKTGCATNLMVIATRDGAEFIRAARQLRSPLLRALDKDEQDKLAASREPARSWTVTDKQDENGFSFEHDPPTMLVHDMSRLRVNTRESIVATAVVIEWPAMVGKSSVQIADYAVMRTLAKTRPPAGDGVGSILTLFDGAATPPGEWTQADRTYLRSLYDMPAYISWRRQVDTLASDVERAARPPKAR